MKKLVLLTAGFIQVITSSAQTLQDAIAKTDNERFEAAALDYRVLIAKESSKGENYFYYGENFFKKGDLDSANYFYQKGADLNATYPLNYVGLGKVLWYKGKTSDAKTLLYKAATLGANKNTEVMRKTAEIYINAEEKSLDEAISLLNGAIKIDPKNADNHLLMGDALLEKNPTEGGPAIKEYDKFKELNPKSPKGILRAGKLYQRGRNYQLALDLYKQAEGIDATYAPAYREKAELYHMAGQDAKAIESYKKYLELNNSADARYRYASFLFTNKQYADAVNEIEAIQKSGNGNLYLDRMLGYSYAELGDKPSIRTGCICQDGSSSDATGSGACSDHGGVKEWKYSGKDSEAFNKGLSAINAFFDKAGANFKYVASDYKYKGILLTKTGKDSLGVIEMEKAAIMDPKIANDITTEIAKSYMKSKKYAKAIETFEKKMAGDPKNLNGQDYFDMGRAYYFGPKDFVKSDTCFSYLCRLSPSYATAYFWRGKANVQLDPKNEKWLAKPHFEKALSLVKPEERTTASNKLNIIEACEYLGYNSLTLKDNAKAKEYFGIIRDLDPNNKKQKDFFASPAGK